MPPWSLDQFLEDLELLWFHTSFIPKPPRADCGDPGSPLSMRPQALPKKRSAVSSSLNMDEYTRSYPKAWAYILSLPFPPPEASRNRGTQAVGNRGGRRKGWLSLALANGKSRCAGPWNRPQNSTLRSHRWSDQILLSPQFDLSSC